MQDINLALTSDQVQRLDDEMDACARRLDDLNVRFPNLASDISRKAVEHWRARQAWIQEQRKKRPAPVNDPEKVDPRSLAIKLLVAHGLEDVVSILHDKHDIEITLEELVELIGYEHYASALRKDVELLMKNSVSYEQIAKLWQDLGRPNAEGAEWNAHNVSSLIG